MKLSPDEIASIEKRFPKLRVVREKNNEWLEGVVDLCDDEGEFIANYSIKISVPENYPFGIPRLWELNEDLSRELSRHVYSDGECCVDIPHRLQFAAQSGLGILRFLRDFVLPFFANQVFWEARKEFANGEYKHGNAGVVQFYREELAMEPQLALTAIQLELQNKFPMSGDLCFCDSHKRFDSCHQKQAAVLKNVCTEQLLRDWSIFMDLSFRFRR